jgi:DNA-binding PadR family transcriptional regulator
MSGPTVTVLRALAEGASYGFDVMDATGLPSGTVYPILGRLQERGLVSSRWEAADAHRSEGRPARKYYRLTGEGRAALQVEVERYRALGRPLPRQA